MKIKNLSLQVKLSLVVCTVLVLWIFSGIFSSKNILEKQEVRGGGKIIFLAKEYTPTEVYKVVSGYGKIDRGQINIISEINSHVVRINAKEGDRVQKGQKIVELLNGVFVPSSISGILDKINVNIGDIAFAGQTKLFSIISENKLDAILNIASSDARFVKSGQKAIIQIEKIKLNGEVYFVSKISDKSTNTFEVKIKIQGKEEELFQDETVKISINTVKNKGIFIPTSALSISKENEILITAINKDGIAQKLPVEILNMETDGVWVSTTFSNPVTVIIRGADFAIDGEKVEYKI